MVVGTQSSSPAWVHKSRSDGKSDGVGRPWSFDVFNSHPHITRIWDIGKQTWFGKHGRPQSFAVINSYPHIAHNPRHRKTAMVGKHDRPQSFAVISSYTHMACIWDIGKQTRIGEHIAIPFYWFTQTHADSLSQSDFLVLKTCKNLGSHQDDHLSVLCVWCA